MKARELMSEDDLCDWLTTRAWDASEDSEPVYVVDKEDLQRLFSGMMLVPLRGCNDKKADA
jgi:hypothetical protein